MSITYFLPLVLLGLWLAYLTFLIYRQNSQRIKTGSSSFSPSADLGLLEQKVRQLEDRSSRSLSGTYLLRFNPFEEIGGDQSFVLALLDNSHSGVIITSLHNRNSTRVYAKTIKNGNSDTTLSKEEKTAILKTISYLSIPRK